MSSEHCRYKGIRKVDDELQLEAKSSQLTFGQWSEKYYHCMSSNAGKKGKLPLQITSFSPSVSKLLGRLHMHTAH